VCVIIPVMWYGQDLKPLCPSQNCQVSHVICELWRWTHFINLLKGKQANLMINNWVINIILNTQQYVAHETEFVLTHRYTILEDTEKTWQIINRPTLKHVTFLDKYKEKQFSCGHVLTEGVFLTQLSSNVGIWVWQITNCYFMSDMWIIFQLFDIFMKWSW
jgi:hypothetical protein